MSPWIRQLGPPTASLTRYTACPWSQVARHSWLLFQQTSDKTQQSTSHQISDTRRTVKMARIEAVLLVSDSAISMRRLVQLATLADVSEARELLTNLNQAYDAAGSAFRIEEVATGVQLLTRPEFSHWLDKLHQRQSQLKLSAPAMETLAIVAYRQPITRADIEAIRGVQCSEMLKYLMERNLIRIGGEDDSLGRPYLYVTTKQFLELHGLNSLNDLPMSDRLRKAKAETEPSIDNQDEDQPTLFPIADESAANDEFTASDEPDDNDDTPLAAAA